MTDLRMRPRFALDVGCTVDTLVANLRERIEDADPALEGFFTPQHCVLRIPPERQSLWSPELDLTFEGRAGDEAGIRVRCLFGPRPAVFTGFAFLYAALAAVGFGGLLWGLAQLTLDQVPWGLAVSGGSLLAIGAVHAASFVGQGLAAAQMYQLRRYLDVCVEGAEREARAAPRSPLDSARL